MEVSLPHESPIVNNIVEPKGVLQKKEEEIDEDTDPFLLDDYVIKNLEHEATILLEPINAFEDFSIIPVSSTLLPFKHLSWKSEVKNKWYSIRLPQLKLDPLLLLKQLYWLLGGRD